MGSSPLNTCLIRLIVDIIKAKHTAAKSRAHKTSVPDRSWVFSSPLNYKSNIQEKYKEIKYLHSDLNHLYAKYISSQSSENLIQFKRTVHAYQLKR